MLRSLVLAGVILVVLLSLISVPCYAGAGLAWNGELTVEENIQDGQWAFDSILQLKMALNNDEKQRGFVLLKCKTPAGSGLDTYDSATISVYQAYIDFNLSSNLLLRAGRQKISWGSAFSWNPTNYIGSGKNRAEFMLDNPGVDVLDIESAWENSSVAVVLKPADNWYNSGRAIKAGAQIGHCDLALSAFTQDITRAFGLDFATSVGNYTIYSEMAWKAGEHRFYFNGGTKYDNRPADQFFLHGVVGVNRTFSDSSLLMLEYYYNQAGWSQQETDDFNNYSGSDKPGLNAIKFSTLLADLRRNYLFCMFTKNNFLLDDLSLSASVLWNIDDQSYMITPILQYNIGENAYLGLNINLNYGDSITEFGSLPFKTVWNIKTVIIF